LTQGVLLVVLLLGVVSLAAAQQTPQPVVRLGNFIEVGNDVFIHIMAASDIRYRTTTNYDFDDKVRDRTNSRFPGDTVTMNAAGDLLVVQNRLGVEAKYQKNLTLYLLFQHEQIMDGNTIDDRSNSTTPGGTDVFGRAPVSENPGFHTERYWIDYKFEGTPLRMRVGADLWTQDQAGLVGDDDPRFALFGEFGDVDVMAAAVYQFESQRLGLTNDNDFIYYTFSGGYNLKPHRFQLDVTYFRDRFSGADTQSPVLNTRTALGYQGQKTDSVLIMGSWSGRVGPVRGLIQGNILTGTARGGTNVAGLPAGATPGQHYDIFAGAVVAYAEADFGIVRPFLGFIYGSGDGDPTDHKLHGFMTLPVNEITLLTGTPFFEHLDTSTAFQRRDYNCPALLQGVRQANVLGGSGIPGRPFAVGGSALGAPLTNTTTAFECAHSTGNPFNDRIGNLSTPGLKTTYANPGTFDIPIGVRVFPLKGHEVTGWFVHRRIEKSGVLDRAFLTPAQCAGVAGCVADPGFHGHIRKALYNEVGGFWMWTLNPYFDIRLSGTIAIPDGGYRDIGRLANCNPSGTVRQGCTGSDPALQGEARFRARF
jgi:hypothetical protein